jgi:uncharacterized iron-regulated membrane protein
MRLRAALLKVHLWLSLAVGLVFAVAAGTGAILSFQHEIDAFLNREVRYEVTGGDIGFERIVEVVGREYPGHRLELLWFPRWNVPTYEASLERGGEWTSVHLDPGSGRILPEAQPASTFTATVVELHTSLLGGEVGHWVVAGTTIASILILLTGAYLWWPGIRRIARGFRVRTGRTAYILNFDLHQVAGILSLPLLLAMSVTGVVLVFPDASSRVVHALFLQEPALQDWTSVRSGAPPPGWTEADRPSQRELLRRAHAEVPGAETFYITWPETPEDPVHVRLQTGIEPKPWGITSRLAFDQFTGELLQVVDPRRMNAPEALVQHWNDRLHFGDFAGHGSRLAYLLACLAGVGLVVTGYVLWWLKRSRKAEGRARREIPSAPQTRGAWRRAPAARQRSIGR